MKVAFYAPLKSPLHPTPSGDRSMARQLMACLGSFSEVSLATEFRSLEKKGDPEQQQRLIDLGRGEARDFIEKAKAANKIPDLWFTYHLYYKAPDLIGPVVARELGIPYVAAEASRAPKRANGPWKRFHERAEEAIDQAKIIFHLTMRDLECLEQSKPLNQKLVYLPPFVELPEQVQVKNKNKEQVKLITIAMMRSGDKLASYELLAQSLEALELENWTLDVIGGGPAAAQVLDLLSPFGNRVTFHGQINSPKKKADLLSAADIFVWPGINEAFGLVYLEAQAEGLPIVAAKVAGVPEVVADNCTGLLAEHPTAEKLSQKIEQMISNETLRAQLSANARHYVNDKHSTDKATQILRDNLKELVSG